LTHTIDDHTGTPYSTFLHLLLVHFFDKRYHKGF
jgi:hypothetical protein